MPKPTSPHSSRFSRGDKPSYGSKRSFGDRPARKSYGDKPSFGDRKPFGERTERSSYGEKRSFGDKKPYGERRPYGDKPSFGAKRSFGDRKPFGERKSYGDRPSYGDRKPSYGASRSYGDRSERPSYGDRKPSYGDKKPYVSRPWGERKPMGRSYGDKPSYAKASSDKPDYEAKTFRGPKSSWEPVAPWYDDYMGKSGGDYQKDIVFPGALKLLEPKEGHTYLDLACGQGAFSHLLSTRVSAKVIGIDASPTLVQSAKEGSKQNETFEVGDARTSLLQRDENEFDGAVMNLAIQNIDPMDSVFRGLGRVLKSGSNLVITMNHPCFRQPRQSGWGWDDERKLQYRRIDRYMASYEQPIIAHPGSAPDVKTYSYHRPLQVYIQMLNRFGFTVDAIEEWTSNRVSDSGPRAKAENFARNEFPLFLAIRAKKI